MRIAAFFVAVVVAFLLGTRAVGQGGEGGDGGNQQAEAARELAKRQKNLFRDLKKIDRAIRDVREIQKTRAEGFELNDEEIKLEKKGKKDFHIFMERYRNNTLEVLQIYDRVLAREGWRDPLRAIFGKSLDEAVRVAWDEQDLDEIIDQLSEGYGVKIFVKGDVDLRRTMSLEGDFTLMSILLQVENVFDARLVVKEGRLWIAAAPPSKPRKPAEPEAGAGDAKTD